MRRAAPFILMLSLLGQGRQLPPVTAPATAPAATQAHGAAFVPVDVFIDPQGKPLACYEMEIIATQGDAKLVGIAGGDDVFEPAPYYDPRALHNGNRVVIGAYTLKNAPPTGKIRVASLSFFVTGPVEPHFQAILRVAAADDETLIPATVSLVVQPAPRRVGSGKTSDISRGMQ